MAKDNNSVAEGAYFLDKNLETPEERNELVKKIIDNTPAEKLTPKYLDILAQYIINPKTKEERKKKNSVITNNRMQTVEKRETSYQGLIGKLENGEDSIYNMIINDKNVILTPKVLITAEDVAEIPGMKELQDAIEDVEEMKKKATGKRKYSLHQQIIKMRQDQYVLRNSFRKPIYSMNLTKSPTKVNLSETITIDANYRVSSNCLISFFDPKHICALLCNYSKLKEDTYGKFESDSYYMMMDLDNLIEDTLKEDYPYYYDLLIYKIDGKQNLIIQDLLYQKHHVRHSIEYLSSLWRNKIPKLLAEKAEEQYLNWYYTAVEKGNWKKCSRCGQIKLANNHFFSKNNTSKDGYYSICKCCRNKKRG